MRREVVLTDVVASAEHDSARGNMHEIRVEVRVIFPPDTSESGLFTLIDDAAGNAKEDVRGRLLELQATRDKLRGKRL
jgi:hypothetical protein